MINYLERPAPSRLTPWPGNPINEMSVISCTMKSIGSNNGMPGKKLKVSFKGVEKTFDTIGDAAEFMDINRNALGRNLLKNKVPQVDGIDWIELDGTKIYRKPISYTSGRGVKAIVHGEEIIFKSISESLDFFMVTRQTIHSWIKSGCARDNGVEYIGYYG